MKSQEIGNTSWHEKVQDVYAKTLVQLSEISDLSNVSSEHSTFLYISVLKGADSSLFFVCLFVFLII